MESLLHQLRIEQAKSVGYEKNGFAAAVKGVAANIVEPEYMVDAAEELVEWITVPPVRRPDAFKVIAEEQTVVAFEVVHSHGIKDNKALWYAKLHAYLLELGWELNIELVDAVTGRCQTIDNPYQCWGLLIPMSAPGYDPRTGIHKSIWPYLRGQGMTY